MATAKQRPEFRPAPVVRDGERTQIELTDPRQMRAVAHPTRLALLGLLRREGALTATQAGQRLGESSGSTSFHLRQLAKYGLVEEAPGASGRSKPWQATAQYTSWSAAPDNPEMIEATNQFNRMLVARYLELMQSWVERQGVESPAWLNAAPFGDNFLWLTAEELTDLDRRVTDLMRAYEPRRTDASLRPEGSRMVSWLRLAFPVAES